MQADGKILAGGAIYAHIGGQPRNHIARLDPTTGLADSFNPNATGDHVHSIAVQADGKILAGGDFTASADRPATASPGSIPRPAWLIRSTRTRTICPFNRGAGGRQDFSGRLFHHALAERGAAVTRNRIARLETDGRLDQTLNLRPSAPMLLPPPCRRTVRFLSAAASAPFWE